MHDIIRYGLKACKEKAGQEFEPREEERRGAALKKWRKLCFCLILYKLGTTLKLRYACLYWEAYNTIQWLLYITNRKKEA